MLSRPLRLAAPVVLVYWLMLAGGLALYTVLRMDDAGSMAPLWVGAIGGTVLGQFLALRGFRFWIVAVMVMALLFWGVPLSPPGGTHLWMAFAPAVLCGYWSLSDRGSLVAFWFPAMIWMLSILDHTSGTTTPDRAGVVLLGGLAVVFIVFLRVRESRRVGLWRTFAAAPLATPRPVALLQEPPGRPFARAGWTLLVSALTFAVTAWVAPRLWQIESLEGDPVQIADDSQVHGLPCCHATDEADTERARVKEYFDLGRGHGDKITELREGLDCQVCEGETAQLGARAFGGPIDVTLEPAYGYGHGESWSPGSSAAGTGEAPPAVTPDEPARAPIDERVPSIAVQPPVPAAPPVQYAPEQQAEPPNLEPPPISVPPASPEPPQHEQPAAPAAQLDPPAPSAPQVSPARASPPRPRRSSSNDFTPSLLYWAMVIVAAAFAFQLVSLALRPLRRLITLRHLRRPFWDETVDQRVSNAWQLALIGLRDAGFRSTSTETPAELARRVEVDGLERCATILERTRHGIGIDADDLAAMSASADAAYGSARGRLGPLARFVAWIRWPLT